MAPSSSSSRTYYDILGVEDSVDQKAIRQAYLRQSLKHHPDKNPNDTEAAKARFVEIGQAYQVLSDPTQRAPYDRALRSAAGAGAGYYGNATSASQQQQHEAQAYESYRDAFDATVAGMSEAELAVAVGAISVVANIVGSIVGSRLAGKAGGGGGAGGSILSAAGSMVGSMVASKVSGDAVQALRQQSVERIAYKEDVRRAVERGDPMPAPPPKSKWEETIQRTMDSVKKQASSNNTHNTAASESQSQSQSQTRGEEAQSNGTRTSWQEQFRHHVDSAQTKAATEAATRTADALWQKARQGVQNAANNLNK
jgi:curved DNA-binding protein CbpA